MSPEHESHAARSVLAARLSNLAVNENCTCGAVAGQKHMTGCIVDNVLAALAASGYVVVKADDLRWALKFTAVDGDATRQVKDRLNAAIEATP